jgi:putative aldouronate transport system substrate-binding protein
VKELENMHPEAVLNAYPLPSLDGKQPAKLMVDNPAKIFTVVNKKYSHPEALVKLFNCYMEIAYGPNAKTTRGGMILSEPHAYEYFLICPVNVYPVEKNLNIHRVIKDVLVSGDENKLDAEMQDAYSHILRYRNNPWENPVGFAYERIFGPEKSSYAVMDVYENNNLFLINAFTGAPTPTMATRRPTLDAMRDEVFTKIIMGSSPLSAFDTFVSDWKRQGGDAITKELNDRAAARK